MDPLALHESNLSPRGPNMESMIPFHEGDEEKQMEFDEQPFDWERALVEDEDHPDDVWIDLSNKNIKQIPKQLIQFTQITHLDLSYNYVTCLPEVLFVSLTQLRSLELNGNPIAVVPDSISKLSMLEILQLKENRFNRLPDSICSLENLTNLALGGNKLFALPENFGNLVNLKQLDLTENHLESLPESFGNLTKLEILDVSFNKLQSLPKSFGSLKSLEILQLSNNKDISELPDSFGELPSLVKMDLSFMAVKYLPETFASCSTLETLIMDGTSGLCRLPEWIGHLPRLCELSIKEGGLVGEDVFPESFGKTSRLLVKFDVSGNFILNLPESFALLESLTVIDVGSALYEPERKWDWRHGNNINAIPSQFGLYFRNLIELRLDECAIQELPSCFGEGMENLKVLDLHHNMVKQLPDSFCKLTRLEILTLSTNGLKRLPDNFGNLVALKELYLSNNQLDFLPFCCRYLEKLKVLDLYGNPMKTFPLFLKRHPILKVEDLGIDVPTIVVIGKKSQFPSNAQARRRNYPLHPSSLTSSSPKSSPPSSSDCSPSTSDTSSPLGIFRLLSYDKVPSTKRKHSWVDDPDSPPESLPSTSTTFRSSSSMEVELKDDIWDVYDDFIHNRPPQTRYEVHIEPHVDDFIPYRGYKRHCLDIDKRAKRPGFKISSQLSPSPSKGRKLKTLPEGFEEGDFAGLL